MDRTSTFNSEEITSWQNAPVRETSSCISARKFTWEAEALRKILEHVERGISLNPWLPFPQNVFCKPEFPTCAKLFPQCRVGNFHA
jgi:hypothetical protein